MTGALVAGTRVQAPGGELGIVVVTSYRSNIFFHPGEPVIATVDVLFDGTGQVITYRSDRLRQLVGSNPPTATDERR